MPAWLIPALKAVLPHVGTIISMARPVFTKKAPDAAADQTTLQQQITELQTAASANDGNIRALAEQMQTTLEALEKLAALADARHRRVLAFCMAAVLLALLSLGVALIVFFTAHVAA